MFDILPWHHLLSGGNADRPARHLLQGYYNINYQNKPYNNIKDAAYNLQHLFAIYCKKEKEIEK
ncbi:hypothetical protein A7D23_14840 [Dehalobacter sp. TeCB1]|nr:hypothetical protein DEHRE_03480 [Dehalobacter restrictus DSM 9455]OCZ50411.1 hypothetical protein A7D23_14840 [Dehalobacter sp. TeCB1]